MKWEVKELLDGRWGVFLCEKYWKFKDKPVIYCVSITYEGAQGRVERLNNPGIYDFDEKYVSWGQVKEQAKRQRAAAREEKRLERAAAREEKRLERAAAREARAKNKKKK